MQIGYVYIRPVEVLYLRALGPYRTSAPLAWSEMRAWLDARQLWPSITRGYGVLNDPPAATKPELRRYDACVQAPRDFEAELAPGMGRRTVPGGAYVVHRHKGRHRTLRAGFSYMHRKWVPGHGLQVDPRRPYLEVYLNDPVSTPATELMTDLCVPVFPIGEQVPRGPRSAA
ncbi:MAG TPA: GyrI-like domain-containing protein [Hyphomicrobiaceae bacterium]|nr:GyrI-like domain-containing protein [Hyphomicrobiaceae bacterium]